MTSSDHEILISINGELQGLRKDVQIIGTRVTRLEETVAEIRTGMNEFDRRLTRIEDKVDNLQTSVYWTLASIGIFIAAIAAIPAIFGMFSMFRKTEAPKDDKAELTLSKFGTLMLEKFFESQKGDATK